MTMADRNHRDDLLDRIRLHRQGDKAAIILVEGSPDRAVLRRALPIQRQIFPVGPRHDVLLLVEEVLSRQLGPAVAVVDRDFDSAVDAANVAGLPVIAFDGCDLESMLWETKALDETLESLGSEAKIASVGGVNAVRMLVDRLVLPLQRLRAANCNESLGLDFGVIDLRSRIRGPDLALSVDGLCDSLRRARTDVDRRQLISYAHTYPLPLCPSTARELYRGKDRIAALGVCLKRKLGNLRHQQADVDSVCRLLHANAVPDVLRGAVWLRQLEELL